MDSFSAKQNVDPPHPRGSQGGFSGLLEGPKFKSPGNVMNCPPQDELNKILRPVGWGVEV